MIERFVLTTLAPIALLGAAASAQNLVASAGDTEDARRGVTSVAFRSPNCMSIDGPFEAMPVLTNSPTTGGRVELDLIITALDDVPMARITLMPLGNAVIAGDLTIPLMDLSDGEERTIPIAYDLGAGGESGIDIAIDTIEVTACGEEPVEGITSGAFSVDDGTRVFTSIVSFIDAQDMRLTDAVARGALTMSEAEDEADDLTRREPEIVEDGEVPASTSLTPSYVTAGETNLTGRFFWEDEDGGLHAARNIEVKAFTTGLFGESEVYSGETDVDGRFSVDIDDDDLDSGGETVRIEFRARNSAARVRPGPPATFLFFFSRGDNTYKYQLPVNATPGVDQALGDFQTDNADNEGQAFSIVDGLLEGFDYQIDVEGSAPRRVDVNFPRADSGTASFFSGATGEITVHRSKPWEWDVLLHEYGHFLADAFSPRLAARIGGPHNLGQDLAKGPLGKLRGEQLSWSEGLATYLGTAAQIVSSTRFLNVPRAGDTSYHSRNATSGNAWDYDNEQRNVPVTDRPGDGQEVNVSRVLWDVADAESDFGSRAEAKDLLAETHQTVWQNIRMGFTNLSGYWNATAGSLPAAEKVMHGSVFELNKISPSPTAPAEGTTVTDMPPTFTWNANDRDTFQILIFNDDLSTQLGTIAVPTTVTVSGTGTATYTPTTDEWTAIFDMIDTTTINYVITGQNTIAPPTATYWSGAVELRTEETGDFAFVIDDTGSMGAEIGAVRDALTSFLARFDEETSTSTFQLITFKDNVTVRPPTTDLTEIRDQVASLRASGGGDCPENSVAALNAAINNLSEGGLIQFATDADPRPETDIADTIRLAQERGIRVNVLLSRTCSGSFVTGAGPTSPNAAFAADFNEDGKLDIADLTAFSKAFQDRHPRADFGDARDGVVDTLDIRAFLDAYAAETFTDGPAFDPLGDMPDGDAFVRLTTGFENAFDAYSELALSTGGAFSFVPEVKTNGAAGAARYEAIAENILAAEVEPRVVSVLPSELPQGVSATITIQGQNATFTSESVLTLPAGITATNVTVVDPTRIVADITIASDATLGAGDITVTTPLGDRVETALGEEVIVIETPSTSGELISVSPSVITRGETATVRLAFINTMFDTDAPTVSFGSAVTVDSVSIVSPTELDVAITIPEDAAPGFRRITASGSGLSFTEADAGAFFVRSVDGGSASSIASISSTSLSAGVATRLTISIAGEAPVPGGTTAEIGGTGIEVTDVTVCGTDIIVDVFVNRSAPSGARDLTIEFADTFIARPNALVVAGFVARGDINRDSVVDLTDLRSILEAIGRSTAGDGVGSELDIDDDGFVSLSDFRIWQSDYFGALNEAAGITPTPTTTAVPTELVNAFAGMTLGDDLSTIVSVSSEAAPAPGEAAPNRRYVGLSLDGAPTVFADPDGERTIVALIASWHPRSDEFVTELDALARTPDAPRIIAVAIGERDIDAVRKHTAGAAFPVVLGDQDLVRTFGLTRVPGIVFVDPDATIAGRIDGYTPVETLKRALGAVTDR